MRKIFTFLIFQTKKLLHDVKKIRNDVAHPHIEKYTEQDFIEWTEKIKVSQIFSEKI